MFFDDYPRFLDTSDTANHVDRLNLRHEAIIADNVDVLRGARVLDLASHDGRWTFAALKAGAKHVTAVEAREHLVEHAEKNLAAEGVDKNAYHLRRSDMFDELRTSQLNVDVVLCLGIMYHTLRYNELLHGMRMTGARHIILDTTVIPGEAKPHIMVLQDNNTIEANASPDSYSFGNRTLVGIPSVAALGPMFDSYGYRFEKQFDWPGLLAKYPGRSKLGDYVRGKRVTIRWKRRLGWPRR